MKLDLKKSEMEKDLLMNRNGEIYVTKVLYCTCKLVFC